MARYVSIDDLVERFGLAELIQLTDTEPPYTGAVRTSRVGAAIDMAESEVEGYVSGRYALPLTAVPPFLKGITCDLARYHLAVGAARITERDEVRYKAASQTLSKISKGELQLGAANLSAAGSVAPTAQAGTVMMDSRRPIWGRGGW